MRHKSVLPDTAAAVLPGQYLPLGGSADGKCVLCRFNVGGFSPLHMGYLAQHKSHTGMLLARQQQYAVGKHMRRLLRLMTQLTAEGMQDRVEFLRMWGEAAGA